MTRVRSRTLSLLTIAAITPALSLGNVRSPVLLVLLFAAVAIAPAQERLGFAGIFRRPHDRTNRIRSAGSADPGRSVATASSLSCRFGTAPRRTACRDRKTVSDRAILRHLHRRRARAERRRIGHRPHHHPVQLFREQRENQRRGRAAHQRPALCGGQAGVGRSLRRQRARTGHGEHAGSASRQWPLSIPRSPIAWIAIRPPKRSAFISTSTPERARASMA